jgi:hypothetical protein
MLNRYTIDSSDDLRTVLAGDPLPTGLVILVVVDGCSWDNMVIT